MAYLKARIKGLLFIQPLTWLANLIRCLRHHLRNLSDILSLFCDLEAADGEGCAYLSEETIVQQVTDLTDQEGHPAGTCFSIWIPAGYLY